MLNVSTEQGPDYYVMSAHLVLYGLDAKTGDTIWMSPKSVEKTMRSALKKLFS